MRIAHLLLAFLLMPFTACSLSKIPVDTVVLPSSVQQTQLERATASGLLADVQDKMLVEPLATTKKDKFEGTVVVKGELHGTKGNQAMINGIILDPDYFLNSYNNEWKPEIEVLRGKIVKVKGDVYVHYCEPNEQCLDNGVIKYLRNIEYVREAN